MRNYSNIIKIALVFSLLFSFALPCFAMPTSTISMTLLPQNPTDNIGSALRKWSSGFFGSLNLTGASSSLSFSELSSPVGKFPFIQVTSDNFFSNSLAVISDNLALYSSAKDSFLMFLNNGGIGLKITTSSTTDESTFSDSSKYNFGNSIDLSSGGYKINGANVCYGSTTLNNWFFGNAGNETTDSLHVTAVGEDALKYLESDANFNTAVGSYAGTGVSFATQRTYLDRTMTFIGSGSSRSHLVATSTVLLNGTAIGAQSEVYEDNQVSLGDTDVASVVSWGKLGLGTTSPASWLDIVSDDNDDLMRLSSGTTSNAFVVQTDGDTTIDGALDVQGITHLSILFTNGVLTAASDIMPALNDVESLGGTDYWWRQVWASSTYAKVVGIGTTTPDYPLDVNGIIRGQSDLYLTRTNIASGPYVGSLTNYPLRLGASSTPSLYIKAQSSTINYVGINAETPLQPLHVGGNVRFSRANASGNEVIYFGHDGAFLWEMLNDDASNSFSLGTNSGSIDSKFVMTSGGLAAFGTTTPRSTLMVGSGGSGVRQYLQIDSEAGAPASGDCDASFEDGRIVKDHTADRLYICNFLSGRGWDYFELQD